MAAKGKGFRQIDNELFTALITGQFSGAIYQILLMIIDKTIGFREEKAAISLSKFQDRTGLSRQSVYLAIKQAEQLRLIMVERHSTRVNIYALNMDVSQWLTGKPNHPSEDMELVNQITLAGKPNHPSASQPATPATQPVKKLFKDTSKENNDHFLTEIGNLSDSLKEIISYYFKVYREQTGEPHPGLKPEQWQRVAAELEAFSDEFGVTDSQDFQTMINYHFQRKLKTDYNINHFATRGILENLFYKKLY